VYSFVAIRPPQLAATSATTQPQKNKSNVRSLKCDGPSSRLATNIQRAVTDAPSISHVLRRSLTSTTGVQRNINIAGTYRREPIRAISSTGTPALLRRNGRQSG
jgi:hypothetical protein